jgi:hypothetical protein
MSTIPPHEIKKLHLEELVLFAINHIPEADPTTLKQFLKLVNTDGTFGAISYEQILRKMYLVLKYVPEASVSSLLILMDLLEIEPSRQLILKTAQTGPAETGAQPTQPASFLMVQVYA